MEALVSHLSKRRELTSAGRRDSIAWLQGARSSRVLVIYMCVKLSYLLALVAQYWTMIHLLGIESFLFGWQMFADYMGDRDWEASGMFPRVTLCDFEVRSGCRVLQPKCLVFTLTV